jgi:hypothetical protein
MFQFSRILCSRRRSRRWRAGSLAPARTPRPSNGRGRRIAEAQIDLNRVRASRRRLLTRLLVVDPYYQPKEVNRQRFRLLNWVLGGNRPRNLPVAVDAIKEMVSPKPPEGEEKLAITLEENVSEFAVLDRYERRALSRRKAAIRNFDAARTLAVTH